MPIVSGEWYHCYNRGVDKRRVFEDEDDYERLLALLYICNDADSNIRLIDLNVTHVRLEKLLQTTAPRGTPLVDIGAYAFMPNHVHLIIRPTIDSGLSKFMQKVFTGYTMYFNNKYERTGSLFAGVFKSKHIATDEYFKHAIQYVLLNPVELIEPKWKQGIGNLLTIEKQLRNYRYANIREFFDIKRPEACIVHDVRPEYFDHKPSFSAMLSDAQAYYRENEKFLER